MVYPFPLFVLSGISYWLGATTLIRFLVFWLLLSPAASHKSCDRFRIIKALCERRNLYRFRRRHHTRKVLFESTHLRVIYELRSARLQLSPR